MSKQLETLKDYSQKDWEAFKTIGLGKVLFQFLADSREAKRKDCLKLFDAGAIEKNMDFVRQREMAASLIKELIDLELEDIKHFYEGAQDD